MQTGEGLDAGGENDRLALRVRGRASAEEVAAVVMALSQRESAPDPRRETPPWLRAGLREGIGEPSVAAPSELR